MKASVTSVLAYHDLDLGRKQLEVCRAIQMLHIMCKDVSCETISDYLGYTPNRVTGRLSELRKMGAIEYQGFTKSKFNKNVECYKLVEKGQQSL